VLSSLQRISLIIAAGGTAVAWIVPLLLSQTAAPAWVTSRWSLLVCAPASILGLRAYRRYGGFARTPAVIACSVLMVAGILWTDPTERGRAMVLATAFVMTLPIAALIRQHQYVRPFLFAFSLTTACSLLYSVASASGFNRGTLMDAAGSAVSNANGVGAQAGLAALFVLMLFPGGKRLQSWSLFGLAAVLIVFCVMTASRTSFLALAGGIAVSLMLVDKAVAAGRAAMMAALIVCAVAVNLAVDPESQFYDGLVSRLVRDDEGTRGTFGDRSFIWSSAAAEFVNEDIWLYGTGTGAVNKLLGGSSDDHGRVLGRDGIWRRSAHNTLVWWALTFGVGGLIVCVWLGAFMIRVAYMLDRQLGGWQRSSLVTFALIVSVGAVVNEALVWAVLGSALWVYLSTDLPVAHRASRRAYRPSVLVGGVRRVATS
jgi:hypothetical protein